MPELAVVGLACELPGASTPTELWENCLAGRRAFRRLSDGRIRRADYFDQTGTDPDKTYLEKAALIEGYEFDLVRFRIPKTVFEQADLTHWLSLDVSARALSDAGFESGHGLPKDRVGVVFGNSITGEFSRAHIMRLRWPFVRRAVDAVLRKRGDSQEDREALLREVQAVYKAPFPAPNAETLAGGLSNTIPGRIANYFDFGGGCYTVDGACSSSLLAVAHGCRALLSKEWDVAIVGGVDLSVDPFEVVGFTRNGALARNEMSVFDERSQGFWPGEGCGVALLMRAEDARAQGLKTYAVVKGWGISSDGEGGLTRPKVDKQVLAMRRCYELAGYSIHAVGYFEGHGTGTAVGDDVELRALCGALTEAGLPEDRWVPSLGSIKELIGHTKATAGIAGFIKACLTVDSGLLPPGLYSDTPHRVFKEFDGVVERAQRARPWSGEHPLRVGISSMGFGGINVHATLESVRAGARFKVQSSKEKLLAASQRAAEIFVFSAPMVEQLVARLRALCARVADCSMAELGDLSAALCQEPVRGKVRLAIVARDGVELETRMAEAIVRLESAGDVYIDVDAGIFVNPDGAAKKVGLLFPGQGAPIRRFAPAFQALAGDCDDLYDGVPRADSDSVDTSVAQPAILAASLSGLRLLEQLDLSAHTAVGHSLGELAALVWAGSLRPTEAVALAKTRGRVMMDHGRPHGGMLALRGAEAAVQACIRGTDCVIACYNGSEDLVVAGAKSELAVVSRRAAEHDLSAVELAVSHAFHSPGMAPALEPWRAALSELELLPPSRRMISTIAGRALEASDDLRALLASQLVVPVRYREALAAAADVDLWIEVGPGKTLGAMTRAPVVTMDIGSANVQATLKALAAAFVLRAIDDLDQLGAERFARSLDLRRPAMLFKNPCETLPESDIDDGPRARAHGHAMDAAGTDTPAVDANGDSAPDFGIDAFRENLRQLIAKTVELPLETIRSTDRVLSDLHLNSLLVTEILAKLGRIFAPGDREFARISMRAFHDATIAELAAELFEVARARGARPSRRAEHSLRIDDLPAWVHVFTNEQEPLRAAQAVAKADGGNTWIVLGGSDTQREALAAALSEPSLSVGNGLVLLAGSEAEHVVVESFLRAAARVHETGSEHFVVLGLAEDAAAVSLFPALRTYALEQPSIRCTAIDWRAGDLSNAAALVKREASLSSRYHEVRLMVAGERRRPVLRPWFFDDQETDATERARAYLDAEDILLVTGGGKGITFESALHIARRTGARLGLVGRSSADESQELSINLQRLSAAAVTFHYVQADVCDAAATARAVAAIERTLGPITAFLHGAGNNQPALLFEQTVDKWRSTRAVKVDGFDNCIRALDPRKLRLVITYGSIIAQSGMQGEFDYALSNESLARRTLEFAEANSACRTFCLDWSVWSGTGMGENLKTIDQLKQSGVSPIRIEDGLHVLDRLLSRSAEELPVRLTIASRYGRLPTISFARPPRSEQTLRFVEDEVWAFPGVEIVSETTLSVATDPYLNEHVYHGQRVLPAVIAFEMMAQHVASLAPEFDRITFRNAKFQSPIVIPKDESARVRIAAARVGARRFIATVSGETTDFGVASFRVEILLDELTAHASQLPEAGALLPMDVERDFYEPLLFHRGPFRTVAGFETLHNDVCVARLELNDKYRWFATHLGQTMVLGNVGLNDAAAHTYQGCIPQYSFLPAAVEEVSFRDRHPKGPLRLLARERSRSADDVVIDVDIADDTGAVVQSWRGFQMLRVKGSDYDKPWHLPLLHVYLEHLGSTLGRKDNHFSRVELRGSTTGCVLFSRDAAGGPVGVVVRTASPIAVNGECNVPDLIALVRGATVSRLGQDGVSHFVELLEQCRSVRRGSDQEWVLYGPEPAEPNAQLASLAGVRVVSLGSNDWAVAIVTAQDGDHRHAHRTTQRTELFRAQPHDDLR